MAIQLLDYATTLYAISMGCSEANPFMRGVVDEPVLFLAVKLFACVFIVSTGIVASIVLSKHEDDWLMKRKWRGRPLVYYIQYVPYAASVVVGVPTVANNLYVIMG